jgi:hypothetical protein
MELNIILFISYKQGAPMEPRKSSKQYVEQILMSLGGNVDKLRIDPIGVGCR